MDINFHTVHCNAVIKYSIVLLVQFNVVKRPGTSVPSRYQKNENVTVPGFF